jgi:DNA-binding cell septation regulator SpoVG
MMKFTDMDMLQDYEKDTRMAAMAYVLIQTELIDPNLRILFGKMGIEAAESQKKAATLILSRGDRP